MSKGCLITGLLSLSQSERMKVRDRCQLGEQGDSSPSPSPRKTRRGITDSIAHAISTGRLIFCLLSLSQRERMKVRDCSTRIAPRLTKWLQGRCRVLPALDDSRSGRRQFLVWLEIPHAPDRASRAGGNHGPNHPTRSRVSRSDNRSPGRKDRRGAVAGIYEQRTFDFGDGARECVRNRLPSCGDIAHESLVGCLELAIDCEKIIAHPLTSILSPQTGRGGRQHLRNPPPLIDSMVEVCSQ